MLIVAEHASAKFGGEAVLPLHYFRLLRERGVDAYLLVHERTRAELDRLLASDATRITYVPDTALHKALFRMSQWLPQRIADVSIGVLMRLLTGLIARAKARRLIRAHAIDVVHQPIPVSPKDPSLIYGLGVPVVIGPMNGGMHYPRGFESLDSPVQRRMIAAARGLSHLAHRLFRGKLEAATLLVANERTRAALPRGISGKVELLVENGVDLRVFHGDSARPPRLPGQPLEAIFVGRLVDWKALDIVLDALAEQGLRSAVTLRVLGDGPMRKQWEAHVRARGLDEAVRFLGFVPQEEVAAQLAACHALVLPSLYECGGAVVLEAMAIGLPVVATAWGGPKDYLDAQTGILVEPDSREALVRGFAAALRALAADPQLGARLGERARAVVAERFDWRSKIDRILEVYKDAVARRRAA